MGWIEEIVSSIVSHPIETSGHIYHPIPFDEFDQLKSSTNSVATYRKWDLILSALPFQTYSGVSVLDIGANAGFFSYQFAKLGAHVDAIEPHKRYHEIGRQISEYYGLPVEWFNEPVSTSFLRGRKYELALMLSVFQWMSQGDSNLDEAKSILRTISERSDYLIFELGCNWGTSAIRVKGLAFKWIVDLLKSSTVYSHIAYLGTTAAWGQRVPLVRIFRKRYVFACSHRDLNLTSWQRLLTRFAQYL